MEKLPKIVVILGPTASGKTNLAISLAKKYNGEIISADSRQIYQKMDVGTAKPEGEWKKFRGKKVFVSDSVPYYLVDVADPGNNFTLADFKARALEHIADIISRGKLPFVVGGTGLYLWSILENLDIPQVAPNLKLRRSLEKKSLPELVTLLKETDPDSAEKIDLKNTRRVLRALEVFITTGESFFKQRTKSTPLFDVLKIGLIWPKEKLYARIEQRIDQQMKQGLEAEVQKLLKQKYGPILPSMSSLGYKQIAAYLRGETTLAQAVENFKRDTRRYAKRQMTWFKRDKDVIWLLPEEFKKADKLINDFLKK